MIALALNPRYVAYAYAYGRTPEDMLDHDVVAWPGGKMCGFLLWNRERVQEYAKVNPDGGWWGRLVDHAGYDAWLAARVGLTWGDPAGR